MISFLINLSISANRSTRILSRIAFVQLFRKYCHLNIYSSKLWKWDTFHENGIPFHKNGIPFHLLTSLIPNFQCTVLAILLLNVFPAFLVCLIIVLHMELFSDCTVIDMILFLETSFIFKGGWLYIEFLVDSLYFFQYFEYVILLSFGLDSHW